MPVKRLPTQRTRTRAIVPIARGLLLTLALNAPGCVSGKVSETSALEGVEAPPPSDERRDPPPAAGAGGGPAKDLPAKDPAADPPKSAAEDYALVVASPVDQSVVRGDVTISGRAEGFNHVEVWDEGGTRLGQASPDANDQFSLTIDSSALAKGPATWTVHASVGVPGETSEHSAQVTLTLSIEARPSCAGESCSGHGSCLLTEQANCLCDPGYHPQSALACVAGADDPGIAFVPAGYHLAFADEFSDATLDNAKWNTRAPWNVQWYADSKQMQAFIPEAVSLKDGTVTFTAEPSRGNTNGQPYASGSITSNRTFTYGYFEARVSLPAGKGLWPAYWLTSSVRWPPEFDIFEVVDGVDYGYTHIVPGGKFEFVEGAAGSDSAYPLTNPYGVYHVYGLRWTPTELFRYVDGVLIEHDLIDAAAGSGDPFWLNLSLQVGGNWPGSPDASTPFPAHMDIDYVRVYQE